MRRSIVFSSSLTSRFCIVCRAVILVDCFLFFFFFFRSSVKYSRLVRSAEVTIRSLARNIEPKWTLGDKNGAKTRPWSRFEENWLPRFRVRRMRTKGVPANRGKMYRNEDGPLAGLSLIARSSRASATLGVVNVMGMVMDFRALRPSRVASHAFPAPDIILCTLGVYPLGGELFFKVVRDPFKDGAYSIFAKNPSISNRGPCLRHGGDVRSVPYARSFREQSRERGGKYFIKGEKSSSALISAFHRVTEYNRSARSNGYSRREMSATFELYLRPTEAAV